MAKYSIEDSTLIAIGDAIREKSGRTETMTPAEMATAILAIETGGGQELADSIVDRTITEIESNVSKVEDHAFYVCRSLTRAIFPNATYVGDNGLRDCTALVDVQIPKATELQGGSVRGCSKLKKIDLPNVTMMYASVFQGCSVLGTIILRANRVCTISNANVFQGTPIESGTGFVFVPDNLVDQYRSATNWSTYAAQIKPLSELEGEA